MDKLVDSDFQRDIAETQAEKSMESIFQNKETLVSILRKEAWFEVLSVLRKKSRSLTY